MDRISYDAIVLTTPDTFERLVGQYKNYLKFLPAERIVLLGSKRVGGLLEAHKTDIAGADSADRIVFMDEDSLLPFSAVHETVREEMTDILSGRELPRGITGWYYQQFLKLSYAYICENEYYLIWDGDTFPCRTFSMFTEQRSQAATPYLDVKREEHAEYFSTMEKLIPGMTKVIGPSFISEHMLFSKALVLELLHKIESNEEIKGKTFWEKIIHAVGGEKMQSSSFSEYETYGTYVAINHPEAYKIREWHSFRLGGEFFDPDTISDRDYRWLGKDFNAISFEKDQFVREDHRNLFDNLAYQKKLSAKQMLLVAQEAFEDGYIESWDNNNESAVNVSNGEFNDYKAEDGVQEDSMHTEQTPEIQSTISLISQIKDLVLSGSIALTDVPVADVLDAVRIELVTYCNTFLSEQYEELMNSFETVCGFSEKAYSDKSLMIMFLESMKVYLLSISDVVKSLANRDYWEYKHQDDKDDPEIRAIIDEVQRRGDIRLLNYSFIDDYMNMNTVVEFDDEVQMCFLMHNGKRMYFPKNWTEQSILDYYHSTVAEQDIRSPHCYSKEGYEVKRGDIVVDAGAAEGIFVLDRIDLIQKAYLFDADMDWIEALKMTFKPYGNKVDIIYGYLNSFSDNNSNIAMNDYLDRQRIDYIKMDIEGYERDALTGARKIFENNDNLRCAICAYHCKGDEAWINEYLNGLGYEYDHSGGYMCPDWSVEGRLDAELRRGVVFGRRQSPYVL